MHRNARHFSAVAADERRHQIAELVERYGNQWIATARRNCSNAADAEDAFQLAVETLLTNPPAETDPERIAAWMHTVVRNEALQIVRSRRREVDAEFESIAGGLASDIGLPENSLVDAESLGIAKEALRRLRPDQTRCLLLRADGFDYPEICRLTGFSYAKVNRLLSEGRRAARARVDAIGEGHECQRIEPMLSAFADGEADLAAEHDIRLHLESCSCCRVTLRDYKLAPRGLAATLPLGLVATQDWRGRLLEPFHRLAEMLQARLGDGAGDSSLAVAKKALAVVAVGATVVGGGAVGGRATRAGAPEARPGQSAAAPPSRLLTPVTVPDRRAAAQRRARARAAAERRADAAGNPADALPTVANDPAGADAERLADTPADQGTGFAPDPVESNVDGTGEADQGGVLAP